MQRLAFLLVLCLAAPAWALERVALQLKWKHQFQFAGYYAAVEKGFYRAAGLEVELREMQPDTDVVGEVLSGRADFGVGNSDLALARAAGKPVVALAVILQHSALVLLARQEGHSVVQDLAGKRIMVAPGEAELFAYLRQEGLRDGSYQLVPHDFDTAALTSGKVDAMSAYSVDETFPLRQARFAYSMFTPRAVGIDFYGDNLFTSERLLKGRPEVAAAFREASLQGWRYAMQHPEEIADLILARYSQRHSRRHLLYEAAGMRDLMQPDLVEIGQMNPGRWRHIADVYASLGMLPADAAIDGLVYDPRPARLPSWAVPVLVAAGAGFLLIVTVAWRFALLNRRLKAEVAERRRAEDALRASETTALDANARLRGQLEENAKLQAALKEQAIRDGLTGFFNRRYLDETLERELLRARREGETLAVVMLDLDHFKRLNDTLGHRVGDEALRTVAALLRQDVRAEDVPCRYGGEEFLILMPRMPLAVAAKRAERWRRMIAELSLPAEGGEVTLSASMGVAAYPEHGRTPDDLTHSVDLALYLAKRQGRNRVVVFDPAAVAAVADPD